MDKAQKLEALLQAIYPVRDMAEIDYQEMFIELDILVEKLNDWQASELRYTDEQMRRIRASEAIG